MFGASGVGANLWSLVELDVCPRAALGGSPPVDGGSASGPWLI
jgi:hypothetical protein